MKDSKNSILSGRNPVAEALKSEREIEKILVQKGSTGSVGKIISMAKGRGIPIYYEDKSFLDKKAGGGFHQGVAAVVSPYKYASVEEILELAKARKEAPLMRSAECAGAHGVIVSKRRAAGITGTVAKTSAGAVEYLPCARVTNIAQTIDKLKELGVWIYACDMGGEIYYKQDLRGAIALVIGNEGSGISRLVKEKCDFTLSIPMTGKISSLNASNAGAILMYEVRKQRDCHI